MSHSTKVYVSIGMTAVEYTFGTGSVAEKFGIYETSKPWIVKGFAARGLLHPSFGILPEHELEFVHACLKRWDDSIGSKEDYEDEVAYNPMYDRLQDQVWISVTRFD